MSLLSKVHELPDDDDVDGRQQSWLPLLAGALVALLFAGALCYWLWSLGPIEAPPPVRVQQITVLQPPPPPPPPPEPEKVEPPEPEKIEPPEPPPEPEPQPKPEPQPEATEQAVDPLAAGEATGDGLGFGLRAGTPRIGGGGGGGDAVIWYGQRASAELGRALTEALRSARVRGGFSVVAQVWIDTTGRVERIELAESSGLPETDGMLRKALSTLSIQLEQSPPQGMPQPIKVRLHAKA